MRRGFGRLAAVLVVGLGVAGAFDATDIRDGPGSARRTLACWIRAGLRTPARPVRDALLQTGA